MDSKSTIALFGGCFLVCLLFIVWAVSVMFGLEVYCLDNLSIVWSVSLLYRLSVCYLVCQSVVWCVSFCCIVSCVSCCLDYHSGILSISLLFGQSVILSVSLLFGLSASCLGSRYLILSVSLLLFRSV